ncbi:MAG TPA: hypothetical protein VFZ25_02825, partial [Chloroflexota bacterium]|nr:hypothetical protein [Chloroflexota bacterium]
VLVGLEHRGLVELEWNPFSDASRGARAEREGALGEALWYYDRAGQPARILACLYRNLPDSLLRTALLEATAELLDLERALATLHPLATVDLGRLSHHVARFSHEMADVLWQTAERAAVASALWGTPDSLPEPGPQVIDGLHELRERIRRVRNELAGLVFFGRGREGLEMALSRSSLLADTIHALTGGTPR